MDASNYKQSDASRNRSRKYDTYIPGGVPISSAIYEPPTQQAPQYQQPYTPPVQIAYAPPAQTALPKAPKIDFKASSEKQKMKSRRLVTKAIIKASVQVEKVTRQSVKAVSHTFEPPNIDALRTRKQKFLVRTFYVVGTASFIFAVGIGLNAAFGKKEPKIISSTGVLGISNTLLNDANRQSEVPSEQKPSKQDFATYLVAPAYPRYLRIPSLQIEARVRRLGLDNKNAVGSPNNIFDAGWYDSSVRPGDKEGSSIIIGHVNGPKTQGLFWDISKVAPGSLIMIEKGNGESIAYKVTKIEKLPDDAIDMSVYLKTEVPGQHDLKLITSASKYDMVGKQNVGRVIVYAQQQ
jgi:hypothetical protein